MIDVTWEVVALVSAIFVVGDLGFFLWGVRFERRRNRILGDKCLAWAERLERTGYALIKRNDLH